jgi:regulator of protease activity HflC (stomatin/prohibitin superfamily)
LKKNYYNRGVRFTQQDNYGSTIRAIDYFFLAVLIKGVKVDREYERGVIFRLVACQLYFDGLLDSQSLAKIDLRVLVAPHFKLDRPLGRLSSIKGQGMYWIMPVVDQKMKVDIRTKTVDIAPKETVTADSVTIKVNAVLYYRILDAAKAINRVEDYRSAVYQTAMTTLRNVVGQNGLVDILLGVNARGFPNLTI